MSEKLAQLKKKGGGGIYIVQPGYELFCNGPNGQFEYRPLTDGNKVSVGPQNATHIINIEKFTSVTGGQPSYSGWTLIKKNGTEIASGTNPTNLEGYDYFVYSSSTSANSFTFTFS